MTIAYPLKLVVPASGDPTMQEFAPGDQITQDLIAGLMGRNRIINGAMGIWQRGTSFNFAANQRGYTADRFFARSDDSGSISVSRIAVPTSANAALSPFNFYFSAQVTAGSGAATQQVVSYPIEGVKTLSGGKAAVSVLMWADAAKIVGVQLYQGFGGGSFNYLTPQTISLTTVPTWYTLIFDVPPVTASFDSTTSRLQVVFYLSAGSNFNGNSGGIGIQSGTFNFTGLQVEAGTVLSGFEFRSQELELALCQRYYEKSFAIDVAPANQTTAPLIYPAVGWNAQTVDAAVLFKVRKRITPAMSFFSTTDGASPVNGTWALYDGSAWQYAPSNPTTAHRVNETGFTAAVTLASSGISNGVGRIVTGHWTADAEL
jgi:hypothetical protein